MKSKILFAFIIGISWLLILPSVEAQQNSEHEPPQTTTEVEQPKAKEPEVKQPEAKKPEVKKSETEKPKAKKPVIKKNKTKKAAVKRTKRTKPRTARKSRAASVASKRRQGGKTPDVIFETLKRRYRVSDISARQLWSNLNRLSGSNSGLSKDKRTNLTQLQGNLLLNSGFPILATLYVSDTLQSASNPLDRDMIPSWDILYKASQNLSIQELLETVARTVELDGKEPPVFKNNWNYFVGNAYAAKNDNKKALQAYEKLKMSDKYFIPAKYQTAMLNLALNDTDQAELALKAILNPTSQSLSKLRSSDLVEINNYTKLALGRLFYQKRQFQNAIKFYRAIDRDSVTFYERLFEEAWTFFMIGYPNHALGALHAVDSPFFENRFNPESSILKAFIYYWMCRYEDSKNALADFLDKHSEAVEALSEFLDRKRLEPETAYQLFENLISGVSDSSLGIPRRILLTAADQDAMKILRDQYASVIEEINRIDSRGLFGSQNGLEKPHELLERLSKYFRNRIGEQFISELSALKDDFTELYNQSQFLYIELLMSERAQILGKELHSDSKIDRVTSRRNIEGWGKDTQSWGDLAYKEEYWLDEVGFYIYAMQPQCKTASSNE